MENEKSKPLQESLNKVAQALIYKIEQIAPIPHAPSSRETTTENSGRRINVAQIIIGGVVTASLGYAIAHYANDNESDNELLFSGIGALVGMASSYLAQKKKYGQKTESDITPIDYSPYQRRVIETIRKTNEEVRQDWEEAMKDTNENQRNQIEGMSWTDDQKESAIGNVLVYKSLIITDYHYTDEIKNLKHDKDFFENLNRSVKKWKKSIVEIINNTKNEQWKKYFSKIYLEETNKNMMS